MMIALRAMSRSNRRHGPWGGGPGRSGPWGGGPGQGRRQGPYNWPGGSQNGTPPADGGASWPAMGGLDWRDDPRPAAASIPSDVFGGEAAAQAGGPQAGGPQAGGPQAGGPQAGEEAASQEGGAPGHEPGG